MRGAIGRRIEPLPAPQSREAQAIVPEDIPARTRWGPKRARSAAQAPAPQDVKEGRPALRQPLSSVDAAAPSLLLGRLQELGGPGGWRRGRGRGASGGGSARGRAIRAACCGATRGSRRGGARGRTT